MKKSNKLKWERSRELAWEIGSLYPIPLTAEYIALSMITPSLGHVHFNIHEKTVKDLQPQLRGSPVVRMYDVTDILFDGNNAHMCFDLDVSGFRGSHYFRIDRMGRSFLAEAGMKCGDTNFHALVRSNTVYFDSDRPSGNYHTAGLFGGGLIKRSFTVENIFDAPVYEKMNRELAGIARLKELSTAVIYLSSDRGSPLGSFLHEMAGQFKKFGGRAAVFSSTEGGIDRGSRNAWSKIQAASRKISSALNEAHAASPFHVIHCHDWHSLPAGLDASRNLALPLVVSLHSTEEERVGDSRMDGLSPKICTWEKKAAREADLVIVPHSSTRQQVINLYGADPEKVVIIPDATVDAAPQRTPGPSGARHVLGIPPDVPVVLFAGEMSHAAGADLLIDALPTVCRNHGTAHFVFAGDGPLKEELEARAGHEGVGHRCRFLGHVSRRTFETLLLASDIVVIPARTWQDEGLAQVAIDQGRPVLTTQQSGIHCVVHGKTGLVTFDNPGSIVWGIQELLFNPLRESMHRIAVTKSARETPSLESVAAQCYLYYEILLKKRRGLHYA